MMQMKTAVNERSGKPAVMSKVSREALLEEAARWESQAREAVGRGAITEAGLLILRGLDCERRARAVGPQVLGVIRRRETVPAGR